MGRAREGFNRVETNIKELQDVDQRGILATL